MDEIIKIHNGNSTRIEDKNGVKIIRFTAFDKYDFFDVAFSTRIGGVSKNEFSTMNLSFTRGDEREAVRENFKRMSVALDVSFDRLTMTYQTHTTNVAIVEDKMIGCGITKDYIYSDIDGFVTNKKDVVLVTSYADCVPIFIVDVKKYVIASSHSGWRGTVGDITKNTIKLMEEKYDCNSKDMIAVVGPSICKKCYEVGEDVANEFKKKYTNEEIKHILTEKKDKKYLLDLHAANRFNLISAGVLPENISLTDICTSCNSNLLFSHRKTGGKRGGLCGFMWLKGDSNT